MTLFNLIKKGFLLFPYFISARGRRRPNCQSQEVYIGRSVKRVCDKMTLSTVQLGLIGTSLLFLCCVQGLTVASLSRDVCNNCHANATCKEADNKYSCLCNFGFIGNGITHCLDKDECKVGVQKICGEHTACHNTHGSYYCICLKGYRPTNDHDSFIPNDGTFCKDINECEVSDICGNNGRCTDIPGSYECYCKEGYKLQNGMEPFQANGSHALCKEVDCGQPPASPNSKIILTGNTTFGNHVTYTCAFGFIADHGINMSVCTAKGTWEGATVVCTDIDECEASAICGVHGQCKNIPGSYECYCKEGYKLQDDIELSQGANSSCQAVDCGQPQTLPHSKIILTGNTTFGSQVIYMCISGFFVKDGHSTSVCTANGTWEGASVCTVIDCGLPPLLPNSRMDPIINTTFGSKVIYRCDYGFIAENYHQNTSTCSDDGTWTGALIACKAIDCGLPPLLPNSHPDRIINTTFGSKVTYRCDHGFIADNYHQNISTCSDDGSWTGALIACEAVDCGPPLTMPCAEILSSKSTTFGSIVIFACSKGFIAVGGYNSSICTADGHWEGANLECKVADCGPPPSIQNATLGLLRNTTYGSTVTFECLPGYVMNDGNKFATCNVDGEWIGANFTCREIDCGTPLIIEHANWMWNNQSTMGSYVFYKCKPGFKDNGAKNFSICLENATWEGLNLTCTVKEDLISNPLIFNETCLQWKKSSDIFGWEILYEFSIFGVRWHDKDFVDKKTFSYITDSEYPAVCLELLPDTNYTLTMTVVSPKLPAIWLNVTVRTTMKQMFGNIVVFNETCLTWTRSFSPIRSLEVYTVFIQARVSSPEGLLENTMFNFSTDKDTPVLCLDLPSAAEYLINITESSTELSAHVNLNLTTYERENSRNEQTFNKTCLWWNKSLNGLQEIYKLYVQGGKWSPEELFQDLLVNINIDQNITAVCLDISMDTQHLMNVTGALSNLAGAEPIRNLTVFNETCLSWRRHSRLKELYVFFVHGYRRYQKDFIHRLMLNVTTDEEYPVVCLELQNGTNYTVNVVSTFYPQYPAEINIFIPISEPPLPEFKKIRPSANQLLKISFQRIDKNGPISSYQVFVIQLISWCSFTCESLEAVTYFNNMSKIQGYVTAELFPGEVSDHLEFSVGDRQYYGDFYNAPLERGKDYCIILRTISKMRTKTCMVMAEVEELSTSRQHMTVVLLGSIAFACFIVLMSYSTARCCNR
ncbi:sushi domain-containing protein 1 isoform X2 [Mixophyes fleayi]|uniref:sushi domain-containing protein 1 isoform X2 n=1 Tax=Mixophyes fleayi TaxID=3061075 RepID=UPI003F4E3BCB